MAGTDIDVEQYRTPPAVGADAREVFESLGLAERFDELAAGGAFGDR